MILRPFLQPNFISNLVLRFIPLVASHHRWHPQAHPRSVSHPASHPQHLPQTASSSKLYLRSRPSFHPSSSQPSSLASSGASPISFSSRPHPRPHPSFRPLLRPSRFCIPNAVYHNVFGPATPLLRSKFISNLVLRFVSSLSNCAYLHPQFNPAVSHRPSHPQPRPSCRPLLRPSRYCIPAPSSRVLRPIRAVASSTSHPTPPRSRAPSG